MHRCRQKIDILNSLACLIFSKQQQSMLSSTPQVSLLSALKTKNEQNQDTTNYVGITQSHGVPDVMTYGLHGVNYYKTPYGTYCGATQSRDEPEVISISDGAVLYYRNEQGNMVHENVGDTLYITPYGLQKSATDSTLLKKFHEYMLIPSDFTTKHQTIFMTNENDPVVGLSDHLHICATPTIKKLIDGALDEIISQNPEVYRVEHAYMIKK